MTASRRIFQVIDFDRTLFDTSLFVKRITEALDKETPGLGAALDEQFEKAYAEERSFFLFRYLREQMGDSTFEALVESVVQREGAETFMLPGARDRIAYADTISSLRPSWGILTYGDEVDQQMKIRTAGLTDAPLLIHDSPEKGRLLASWQNSDGTFALPEVFGGHIADEIIFEDDKLRAFEGAPDTVQGIWVTQFDDAGRRMGEAGLAVVPVKHLAESVEYLKRRF
jgi:hypothetical protein